MRSDRFGGSVEGRFTFVKEVVEAIRATCGAEYPVAIRLTVDELLAPNGVAEYLDINDGVTVCKMLEALGVAYINVSNGIYESFNSLSEPMTYAQGCRTDLIKKIREAVSLPLIAVNMIKEPWYAEKMLQDDLVDFISLGRAVVADPEWAKKAAEGRECEINRCISCTFCFETLVSDTIGGTGPVKCAVNPVAGRETKYTFDNKDGAGKTVAIIGAGVSGLEAARVLALRGFKPVVFEKSNMVGGQINAANKPPRKEKINWIVEYEMTQLEKLGVEVHLNTPATKELLAELAPYAVFVATGATSIKPASLKGVDLPTVLTAEEALMMGKALSYKNVCVVGSGATGLETAETLCENHNNVTVIEMMDKIGGNIYVQHYLDAMDKLSAFELAYMPSTKLTEITATAAITEHVETKEVKEVAADYVVLSLGVKSVNCMEAVAKEVCDKVVCIGDAAAPGRIESAVRTAFEAAYAL